MNKTELIKKIAQKADAKVSDSEKIVNSFIETVSNCLKKKDSLTMVGFGTFKVANRKARTGVNPKTGQKIQIKASRIPKFVAGKALKESIK